MERESTLLGLNTVFLIVSFPCQQAQFDISVASEIMAVLAHQFSRRHERETGQNGMASEERSPSVLRIWWVPGWFLWVCIPSLSQQLPITQPWCSVILQLTNKVIWSFYLVNKYEVHKKHFHRECDRQCAPVADHSFQGGLSIYIQPVNISKRGCLTSASESINSPKSKSLRAELRVPPLPLPATGPPCTETRHEAYCPISTLMTILKQLNQVFYPTWLVVHRQIISELSTW